MGRRKRSTTDKLAEEFAERFGQRMAELRDRKGITQERLAELTDIGAVYVAKLELGMRRPSFDLVAHLAKALGVPAREMFNFDDATQWQGVAWEAEARQLRELITGKPAKDVRLLREMAAKLWGR